jgi:hypothetical protein
MVMGFGSFKGKQGLQRIHSYTHGIDGSFCFIGNVTPE